MTPVMRRWMPWPRSLVARTAVVFLTLLLISQALGLAFHALDRIDVIRHAQVRVVAVRAASLYRSVLLASPAEQMALVKEFDDRDDADGQLAAAPPQSKLAPADADEVRRFRKFMLLVPMPDDVRPRQDRWYGTVADTRVDIGLQLPDGRWLNMSMAAAAPWPWLSSSFMIAFALMSAAAVVLTNWAVHRMIEPVEVLAAAAERLGRDLNAPPLPEDGPTETAKAAGAFNTMAVRMRRMLTDRNLMLAAISHDLRTPITRLRLRAEFIDDEDQRLKMLSDLDDLEGMVSASLAVGRDFGTDEPVGSVDLVALVRTVLDETADSKPDSAAKLQYRGAAQLTVRARPLALKRALTNLIQNAVAYGGSAVVTLYTIAGRQVALTVEDEGPGIPPDELERLFQPFQRLETSRNRETGGVGLGLTIARNILRAHGGEVTLANRASGGARALVTLPV